ncbi:MAG: hypothetical protein Q4A55_04915 [Aerococcus sp.]|nr:hypothetical protein [Aerococcus sp.]
MDNQQQQALLETIKAHYTGDIIKDMRYITDKLHGHFEALRQDEAFRKVLEDMLIAQYPENRNTITEMWRDLSLRSDDEFIMRMFGLVDDDQAPQAQFQMNLFIWMMEAEFRQFKPKFNEKYLSIYDDIDLFEFNLHESPEMELRVTDRNYAGIYITYAKILLAANEWQEAAEAYQQALLWNPYDVRTIFDLAALYQQLNQYGMSYATTLNGLKYAIRPQDLARGFNYLGNFYRKKEEDHVAYGFYQLSHYWQPMQSVSEQLAALNHLKGDAELDLEEDGAARAFLARYNIGSYPNLHHLNALKAFASRMYVAGQYSAAYTYYSLYHDLLRDKESGVEDLLAEIEAKLAKE